MQRILAVAVLLGMLYFYKERAPRRVTQELEEPLDENNVMRYRD